MLKRGLVSATFKALPIESVIKLAKEAELECIEWSENHHIKRGDESFSRSILSICNDNSLEIVSYGSYFRLGQNMDIRPSLDSAKSMNAPFVRIWAGCVGSQSVDKILRERLTNEAIEVARIAANYDIPLALEWHKDTLTDTNESAYKLLCDVNSAYLRTYWQPTQALTVDEREAGLALVREYVEALHVYYWDKSGRRALSEGASDWKRYLSLLDSRDHACLLEFVKDDSVENFMADARVLKSLIDNL